MRVEIDKIRYEFDKRIQIHQKFKSLIRYKKKPRKNNGQDSQTGGDYFDEEESSRESTPTRKPYI